LLDVDRHLLENAGRQGQVEDAVRLVLVLHQLQLLVEQLEASASIVAAGDVLIERPELLVLFMLVRLDLWTYRYGLVW